jgi:soluble lytic murein transglycosylase
MPRIPGDLYNQQQVSLNPLPGPRRDVNPPPNPALILGNAASQIGADVAEHQAKQRDVADDLRVEESINTLRERQLDLTLNPQSGYSSQLGRAVVERKSGKPFSDEYLEQFRGAADELGKSLTSERQRQKFQQRANILGTEFRSGLMRHETAQMRAHGNAIDEGVVKVETENAARNWTDPGAIETALARIDSAVERKREREGVPAELVTDIRRDIRSTVHKSVVSQALGAKNFKFVEEYLKENATDMNAKDLLEAQTLYRKEEVANFAVDTASVIVREAERKSVPNVVNNLFSAVAEKESGNRQLSANGLPVTSPKGAIGVMQVMPGTGPEAARLAGLPWDENRLRTDEGYNRALGEAYLREQLKTNRGDVARALAAYNAGPGALAKALEAAAKDGKPGDWLAKLPAETQDYVQKIVGKLATGIQPPRPSLLDLQRQAEQRAGADPEKRQAVVQELQRQYQALEAQRKQRDEETLDRAYKELEANGGNFYGLPLSVRANLPGDKLASVHSYAKSAAKRASGVDNETNPAAYFYLSDERVLKGMAQSDFYAYREQLSEADFKHFTNEYRKANGEKAAKETEDLNSGYIKQVLDNRLRGIKIDPTPDDKSSSEQQRVGAIRRYIDQEILNEQKARSKKLTDAEIQNKIDSLFSIDQRFQKTLMGVDYGGVGSRKLLETTIKDIPADIKKTIEDGFKARRITPSDQDILTVYLRMRTVQNRR